MELEIKGTKTGFIINISETVDFINARRLLLEKFEGSNEFFRGSRFIKFNAPGLKNSDIKYLKSLLEESYDIIFEEEDTAEEAGKKKVNVRQISSSNVNLIKDKITSMDETINRIKNLTKISSADAKTRKEDSEPPALPTKFLFENLRSGAEIEYDGNVVIFGDVNPGAKITATGNIVVLGSFRGMAHAGKGNTDCFLAALKLLPLQIRIEDMFAVPPEDATMLTNALVKNRDGEIVIENF